MDGRQMQDWQDARNKLDARRIVGHAKKRWTVGLENKLIAYI